MAKFFGKIGFAQTEETEPGIWNNSIVEKDYYGDITRNTRRWNNGEGVNDNLDISNEISVVADKFAYDNLQAMKYIVWLNAKWKITNASVQYPRLVLSVGGMWNENET